MTTVLIILGVIVLAIVALLAYASTRPASFRVQRSTTIKAPPEKIFPLIEDFHRWGAWSPWEKMDPQMVRTFSGAPSGRGSIYAWAGKKSGAGKMEITEVTAPSTLRLKLDFSKPFEAHNITDFTLTRRGDATEVNWAMYGPSPLVARVMGIFMNMDQMIGKDFEKGLAAMKAASET